MSVLIVNPDDQGYSSFPATLPPYIGAAMFETFLYGLYFILFAICLYVLRQHKETAHWILPTFAIGMFIIATTDIIYSYYLVFGKLFEVGLSFTDLRPKYWLYVTNNVLADTLLLHRCYTIWDRNVRVVLGPIILLVAGTACGYVFEGSQPHLFTHAWIYPTLTLILNVILTSLTVGRIGWYGNNAELFHDRRSRYNATIAILVESGFIYSLYVALDLATLKNKIGHAILDAGLIQIVGIVPTLIIVQVGLGREVHNLRVEANSRNSIMRLSTVNKKINTVESDQNALPSLRKDCHCASNDTFVYHPDLER